MTDTLKNAFASRMDRYFDSFTPCELFRGLKPGSKVALMQPTLVGFYLWKNRKLKIRDPNRPRFPDVLVTNPKTGNTPQYVGGIPGGEIKVECEEKMEITAEMIRNADDYMVRGCRTMKGEHRGLSLFNDVKPGPQFDWFVIKVNTPIPGGLAVTRDADSNVEGDVVHYTVAPKDDMTLALYLVQLKTLGKDAVAFR